MIGFVVNFDSSNGPKYIQLYEYIKKEIELGTLKSEEKLPSVRSLSKMLNVSKVTVENAYRQLEVEGYIQSKRKSGYYVTELPSDELLHFRQRPSIRVDSNRHKPLDRLFNTDGTEANAFNFHEWKKSVNRVLDYDTKSLLAYGDPQGEYILRAEIAKYVHQSRGCICTPEQIVIGAGIQYLFGLIATGFKSDSMKIAFEYPGFSKGMFVFEDYGFEMKKIPLEKDGIDIKLLESSNANMVYVSPSHQYPTGSVMSIKKRLQLLEWAKKKNAYIIEDDYDSLLRYEGYPVPALQGLSEGEQVIYVGSFSKLLIPAIRISFMILPEPLINQFDRVLKRYSQSVSKIEQLALVNFMMEGSFEKHIRKIRKIYGKKNQRLKEAFKRHEHELVTLVGSDSGLHVTLSFHEKVMVPAVIDACHGKGIILEEIVGYRQGNIVVFSYSGVPDDKMDEVVFTLLSIVKEHLKQNATN